ncbi:hypothetical protein BKA67DRAFT_652446 [Truncatella angustata]|uniref:CFEM domain-containing protein n=1 Tax=Truncatella angustata TaxID=152316 RepID=A0A9P8UVX6_9PEZI|nr:uncharacterized protein BKA67DRAFT_652446 [Truncatella angustata]KAH6659197.1 hypothetical protein BKA67DRAFT_652446 [Truncatella angustata]
MKSAVVILAFSVASLAQPVATNLQYVPPLCALRCFLDTPRGLCGEDVECLCRDDAYVQNLRICATDSSCSDAQKEDMRKTAKSECAARGVDIGDEIGDI